MFNKNQLVRIKWNNTNREWFENKGYINLLRIPYWDGDKIKEIISNKILSLKI